MPTLAITRTDADGATLHKSDIDNICNSITTFINTTKLDSSNIQSGAITNTLLASSSVATSNIQNGAVGSAQLADNAVTKTKLDSSTAQPFLVPTGTVFSYAGSSSPTGYLICDGSAVSRTTYSNLYAAVGNTYGSGDGSTTFNLPDCRGRVVGGAGNGPGLTSRSLGGTTGEETHQLVISEIPSHVHPEANGFQFVTNDSTGSGLSALGSSGFKGQSDTGSTGGDGAHNNMQPTIFLNYIIKT